MAKKNERRIEKKVERIEIIDSKAFETSTASCALHGLIDTFIRHRTNISNIDNLNCSNFFFHSTRFDLLFFFRWQRIRRGTRNKRNISSLQNLLICSINLTAISTVIIEKNSTVFYQCGCLSLLFEQDVIEMDSWEEIIMAQQK